MATTTFSLTDITDSWTLLVDGATYQRFGVQVDTNSDFICRLAIASAVPAANSEAYITLGDRFTAEFNEELAAADKVYVRSVSANGVARLVALRGFRVSR